MRAYSMDLRERVLRDSDAGMTAAAVAVTSHVRIAHGWANGLSGVVDRLVALFAMNLDLAERVGHYPSFRAECRSGTKPKVSNSPPRRWCDMNASRLPLAFAAERVLAQRERGGP